MEKSFFKAVTIAGCAIFAMFFGAGNLIHPINIGVLSTNNSIYATIGIIATGVVMPFIGLIAITLFNGKIEEFFLQLNNKYLAILLPGSMLLLLGPLGSIPRCITVAFGGLQLLTPRFPALLFNILFSAVTLSLIWKKNRVIEIIGKWLTPLLLLNILVVIIYAVFKANNTHGFMYTQMSTYQALILGINRGYQPMDLFAAFFFGATAYRYLNTLFQNNHALIQKGCIAASILGIILFLIVHLAFVYLGARYSEILRTIPLEQAFVVVSRELLGEFAKPVSSIIIILACLTTAIALADLISNWLAYQLQRYNIPKLLLRLLIIVSSAVFALTGLNNITNLLNIVLTKIYPAIIVFAICSIIDYFYHCKSTKWAFWIVLIISLILQYF